MWEVKSKSFGVIYTLFWAYQVVPVVKKPPANTGDVRDTGLIPGSGRSPEGGNGYPLQYSYLENSMDRGAWLVTVHRVEKSWIQMSDFHFSLTLSLLISTLGCFLAGEWSWVECRSVWDL